MAIGLSNVERKRMLLQGAREQLGHCRRCDLCRTRQNLVFGGGNPDAPIMLVGGAVTWEEDASGLVLKGGHGGLVGQAMAAVGLDISRDVYAATVLKCQRPYVMRDGERTRAEATPEQVKACGPWLRLQRVIVSPVIIVAHGRLAGQVVFGEARPFGQYLGSWRTLGYRALGHAAHNPAGLLYGDRRDLVPEYLESWRGIAERLNLLGRLWRPDADCFTRGWTYQPPTTNGMTA